LRNALILHLLVLHLVIQGDVMMKLIAHSMFVKMIDVSINQDMKFVMIPILAQSINVEKMDANIFQLLVMTLMLVLETTAVLKLENVFMNQLIVLLHINAVLLNAIEFWVVK
jgi:hypothetical protein